MAQKISQGNIFGRIGSGIGQGLAEQVPKEIERSRLASGLKELGEQKGLSPFQRFAQLSAIPGITHQQIESGSRLLEKEGLGNSYGKIGMGGGNSGESFGESNAGFNEQGGVAPQETLSRSQKSTPGLTQPVSPKAEINPENPTSEKYTPRKPWSPERRNSRIFDLVQQGFEPQKAEELATGEENRYLAMPAAERAIYDRNEEVREAVDVGFKKKLGELLQKGVGKEGERPLYEDITGEQIEEFKKNVEEDLKNNPNLSKEKAIDKWATKALDLAKTKVDVRNLGARGNLDKFTNSLDIRRSLENYGETFRESGNEEEYFNMLQQLDENGNGFGLSPQSAAYFAYPRSERVNSELASFPKLERLEPSESIKLAKKMINSMTTSDNPLAIAKYMSDKNPYFNSKSFFSELSKPENYKKLNPMQQRMVNKGVEDWTPNWGDISVLPLKRGKLK